MKIADVFTLISAVLAVLASLKAAYALYRSKTTMPPTILTPLLWLLTAGFFLGITIKLKEVGPPLIHEHLWALCLPVTMALLTALTRPSYTERINWGLTPRQLSAYTQSGHRFHSTMDYVHRLNFRRIDCLAITSGLYLILQLAAALLPGRWLDRVVIIEFDWLDVSLYLVGAAVGIVIFGVTGGMIEQFKLEPAPSSEQLEPEVRRQPAPPPRPIRLVEEVSPPRPSPVRQQQPAPTTNTSTGQTSSKPRRTTGQRPQDPAQRRRKRRGKKGKPERR